MELKRVVVTGVGTINPLGKTVEEFFDNLLKGVSGAGPITRFDASKFKTQFACEVKNFDVAQHPEALDKKEARKLDMYTQFAMIAAHEIIKDSGLDLATENVDEIGVVWASGIGGIRTFFDEVKGFALGDGTPRYSPFFVPKMIADIAAGQISMKYGLRGPNYATVSACASSTHALIDAFDLIRLGKATAIVAGGSEAPIVEAAMGGFSSAQALSTRNDSPETASRPFDVDRDGFVMGEGAAGLMLEELEHAKARGAKIYAEIVGGGMTADAYHLTAPHPEGLGAASVMRKALEDAGLKPEDIDYINVHGTSTPVGDIAEIKAVEKVFGEHTYKMNISSTKSMTGHLLGATGALEALACICTIQRGMIPPTINNQNLDPAFDKRLNLTLHTAQKREVKAALSNTFGFGGHNASVIFKKFE
ncbi:MAG: beta-ketoacyl-ACP synthase II [Prevotellaceae bacterium]|jgi:3-oxoacyl-[acyl-carrier-protein] synthase II|nr:beta-ketoacyl-ACP synthase II [Prevotellaceae bacterium]